VLIVFNTCYIYRFEVEYRHGAFYTGGNVQVGLKKNLFYYISNISLLQWNGNADYLFCQKGGSVSILSMSNGSVISLGTTEGDRQEDTINCFALYNEEGVITHHKSGLFKLWNWKSS